MNNFFNEVTYQITPELAQEFRKKCTDIRNHKLETGNCKLRTNGFDKSRPGLMHLTGQMIISIDSP